MDSLTPEEKALIRFEHFDEPAEFLRALHPLDDRRMALPDQWIFRGHWSSEWLLKPSLYRKGNIEPFLDLATWDETKTAGPSYVLDTEVRLLRAAFQAFDESGLDIPEAVNIETYLGYSFSYIAPQLVPFLALAQHHGLPTRLLDWTTQGRVAAYFAAAEITRQKGTGGKLEVIALDRSALVRHGDVDEKFRFVHAPRASNANLHAQSGLFSICSGDYNPIPFDKLVLSANVAFGNKALIMNRLTLPQSKAGELLMLLSYEGVTAATMFPGYNGAVQKLREKLFY